LTRYLDNLWVISAYSLDLYTVLLKELCSWSILSFSDWSLWCSSL